VVALWATVVFRRAGAASYPGRGKNGGSR
jgi:hypothetical protein